MLRNLAGRSSTGFRSGSFLRSNSGISSAIGTGLTDIAGAKHNVKGSIASQGASEPLSFLGGGKIAHLADGSGVCSHGGSVVHAAVTKADNPDATDDFLPLTVDYRSRAYAFGRIPSVHNRRERHGNNEDEVLISRIIDRAVRPLFPKGLINQVQLIATAHAADKVHDPTIVSVNAASLALMRSSVDWNGPIGCVRVGMVDGQLLLHPTVEQMQNSTFDLVYAGTDAKTLMLECVGSEIPEAILNDALELAQHGVKDIIDAQLQMMADANASMSPHSSVPMMITAKMKQTLMQEKGFSIQEISKLTPVEAHSILHPSDDQLGVKKPAQMTSNSHIYVVSEEMQADVEGFGLQQSVDMFRSCGGLTRKERGLKENGIQTMLMQYLYKSERWGDEPRISRNMAVERCMKKAFRIAVLGHDIRVDGRGFTEVREVQAYADVLPSVHGSSFFQRGDTHVLSTSTLGALSDAKSTIPLDGGEDRDHGFLQKVTNLGGDGSSNSASEGASRMVDHKGEKRNLFYLHYDFPPYCTGVVGNAGAVNRRMVGHGNLAERALRPVLPKVTEFPYAIRAFAECTSSSGSSSMASACGATLAMLDAGVPLKGSVAGISIGLVTAREGDPTPSQNTFLDEQSGARYRLLTDILGTEDHYGDMDFKVAGTREGVTAMQLDMKLEQGLPLSVLKAALVEAKKGRLHLLAEMNKAISEPRGSVKTTAPSAEVVTYNPERKRLLIGPGGEMVRYIENTYRCSIDTTEDGVAYVFGSDREGVRQAKALILDIVTILEPGQVLTGEVTEIKDFGAFVKLTRSQEAILHVSEVSHDSTVTKRPLEHSLAVGQRLEVQVLSVDKGTGAVRVSRKSLLDADSHDDIRAASPSQKGARNGEMPSPGSLRDPLPSFPVIPPRKWNKDFFRTKVASSEEVETAMSGNGNTSANGNGHNINSGGNTSSHHHHNSSRKSERKGGRRNASSSGPAAVDKEALDGIRDAVDNSRQKDGRDRPSRSQAFTDGAEEGRKGGILQSFLSLVGMAGGQSIDADAASKGRSGDNDKEVRQRKPRVYGRGSNTKTQAPDRSSAGGATSDRSTNNQRRPARGKGGAASERKPISNRNQGTKM